MINATEASIMSNLGYRILPLTSKEVLQGAIEDMERAGWCARKGSAVTGLDNQLTPAWTPISELDSDLDVAGGEKIMGKELLGLGLDM